MILLNRNFNGKLFFSFSLNHCKLRIICSLTCNQYFYWYSIHVTSNEVNCLWWYVFIFAILLCKTMHKEMIQLIASDLNFWSNSQVLIALNAKYSTINFFCHYIFHFVSLSLSLSLSSLYSSGIVSMNVDTKNAKRNLPPLILHLTFL